MSSGRARDGDLTYFVVERLTSSENMYEVLDKKTTNPASVYTMLDTTTGTIRPEGPPPAIQPAASPSCNVDTTEDSKEKNPTRTNNSQIIVPCLIALLVFFFFFFFFSVNVASTFSLMEIFNVPSELTILQSTSTHLVVNMQDIQFSLENISNHISTQQSIIDQLSSEFNFARLNVELSFENISSVFPSQQMIINQLISRVNKNTEVLAIGPAFTSCAAIKQLLPLCPSGYYKIRSSTGSATTAYCDMTRSCGGITGGWMRVTELDMTDNTTQCPDSLELRTAPLRTCRIGHIHGSACSPVMFSVDGFQYSKVCGRITRWEVQMLFGILT